MAKAAKHDVIQVTENHKWAGCLLIVSEEKDWGVLAGMQIPEKGAAYIRLKDDEYEVVGEAVLVFAE